MTALPDSGDGRPPPAPDALPHPALWSDSAPGHSAQPFDGSAESGADVPARTPARLAVTWAAVAAVVVGAVLVGLAVATTTWVLAVVGAVVGVAGLVTALKAKVLDAVSIGQSPTGPG